ncbi:hypothetical protein [Chryseobacterium sp.]|uniref:hypothetical protein n=1 Tax=Chryseobacterium sp. TaxID=1871047 RepID=UPI002FCAD8B9
MKIDKLIIKEGIFTKEYSFTEGINLIYSKENSKGKSTLMRLIFYAQGYPVPGMLGFDFAKLETELFMTHKNMTYIFYRTNNIIRMNIDESGTNYSLPKEHTAMLCHFLGLDNIKLVSNIIGAIYLDQDKGWSLLNRGIVIGKIKFSIEELIAGLNDVDCNSLLEQQKVLAREKETFNKMRDLPALQEQIMEEGGEIIYDEYEKSIDNKILLCKMNIANIKKDIKNVDDLLKSDKGFIKFVEAMKIRVNVGDRFKKLDDNDVDYIEVKGSTIKDYSDNLDYISARRSVYAVQLEAETRLHQRLTDEKNNYLEKRYNLINLPTGAETEIKKLMQVNLDAVTINGLYEGAVKEKKRVDKELKSMLISDNDYITLVYKYVRRFGARLGVLDKMNGKEDYIFTTDIKSLSGAVLHKIVFAFKMAFVKAIEEKTGILMPIFLDSPKGKELDNENFSLIMDILYSDFKANQIIVASIYNEIKYANIIELKTMVMEQ